MYYLVREITCIFYQPAYNQENRNILFKEIMKRVAVSGGAGQIAYSLLFRIASGELLGSGESLALHILERPEAMPALRGVKMELDDCAYPLLQEILLFDNPYAAFEGVDVAFLVGASPRQKGMERKDLLTKNAAIFVEQGKALDAGAAKDVIVYVVGNPCNTNALVASCHAPSISPSQFFAMTQLDHHRGINLLAKKANRPVQSVHHFTIWGNHSALQVPDFTQVRFLEKDKSQPISEVIPDRGWLEKEFITQVQNRGADVIAARGKSSAASAAYAALWGVKSVIEPTPEKGWFSAGVYSLGNTYGVDEHLFFSFPVYCSGWGEVHVKQSLPWEQCIKEKIKKAEDELISERESLREQGFI